MSSPTPLQSFLGGLSLPVPVHALMLLNGNVFGISGYVHRATKGSFEALMGVTGLILGGMAVGKLEGAGPLRTDMPLPQVMLSGIFVGLGSKLANGCTSGHMIAGIARFSLRSIVATATFFTTGVITARLLHADLPAVGPADLTLGENGTKFLALQALPFAVAVGLYNFAPDLGKRGKSPSAIKKTDETSPHPESPKVHNITSGNAPHSFLRGLAYLTTSFGFAIALRLSNLTEQIRVVSFLLLPKHKAFDSSLFFLAIGAMPMAAGLYWFARGDESPRLGGKWAIPKRGKVDGKLLAGAAIFGVGWGMAAGPGLVNFGRALSTHTDLIQVGTWLGAVVLGGLLA
ncbi:hypothetical protein BDQ12DRAFT_757138 [Crucibulum laeve]|uniref:Uncharacterized protein n=1 Tax=Crucibulum laeve TaxID=68775 RepID=A0A5C3MAR6_9AGAR|nr:hypothetical protein BDQ12DRAFT_757138 [Crucibulum laeve]